MKNIYVDKVKDLEKVKDIECEEESEDFSHLGFRTNNEGINKSETSTFQWFN